MATFGFSVGDFITCLNLIREVYKALSDSRGSSSEYQSLFHTLVSLNQTLASSELIYMKWDTQAADSAYKRHATAMINGIVFERQKCKQLMETFLKSSQPYTDAFVKERGRAVIRNWRKVTWLFQKEDVNKFEKQLQRHLQALRIYTDALFQNQTTANAETIGSKVGSILSDVTDLRTDISLVVQTLQSWGSPGAGSLGYPWEASVSLAENVLLLDANGRSVLLPMLFLGSPMILHDLLNIMYRGIPGHRKIIRREYNITDEEADGALIDESNWNSIIRSGMRISLNVVLQASASWNVHHCPRCSEPAFGSSLQGKRRRCQKCQLTFRVFDRERIVEQHELALSQSLDAIDIDIDMSPMTSLMHPQKATPKSKSKMKQEIQEDYYFQRVHYQRDIKRVRTKKSIKFSDEDEPRKLEVDELPPLHRAAARGILSEITKILDAGEDINTVLPFEAIRKDCYGGTWSFKECSPLHIASWFGKMKAIDLLLDRGANIIIQSANKAEVLEYAIGGENPGIAIMLLRRGADPKAIDMEQNTLLHAAAWCGYPWLIYLLHLHIADLATQNSHGVTPLHNACWNGHAAVVQALLERDVDITVQDSNGNTPLHDACWNGHAAVVQLLLEKDVDITVQDSNGNTPLHDACWNGHAAVVQLLLEKDVDITAQDSSGGTPLHDACWKGHAAVVQLLLEKDVDIAVQDSSGGTPLHDACLNGHAAVVQLLLEKDVNITAQDSNGNTPLHDACFAGHTAVVRLLLERDVDITTRDSSGGTPLHKACSNGHATVVQLLLEKDVDITAQNSDGNTPLHNACWNGHAAIVQALLEKDVNIITQDSHGVTPLHNACWNGHAAVVQLLLEKDVDITVKDSDGNTPLHDACLNGHTVVVRLLLEKDVDITTRDSSGGTPLHKACSNGHAAVVQLLLEKDVDITVQDSDGNTPLHDACWNGHTVVVRLLLERDVDITARDSSGGTPLHKACSNGHAAVVQLLLEKDVDITVQDSDGNTPLHNACLNGHTAVVRALSEKSAQSII